MKGIKVGMCVAAFAALSAVAETRLWVGPDSGGCWNDPENWSPAGKMTDKDTAVFRPAGNLSLSVRYDNEYNYAKGVRFESGTTFIGHGEGVGEDDFKGHIRLTAASAAGEVYSNEFYVAENASCVISNAFLAGSAKRAAVLRTGKGRMTLQGSRWGNDYGKLASWVFDDGTTVLDFKGASQIYAPIFIGKNAIVESPHDTAFHADETTVEVNGVFDLAGASTVNMAGFSGSGELRNVTNIKNLSLIGGPFRFSGHVYPAAGQTYALLEFKTRASSLADADWKFLLGSTDAFSQVRMNFPNCEGSPLGFCSGVGEFSVLEIQGETKSMLNLEDEDGGPVTLSSDFTNAAKLRLCGSGSFLNNKGQRTISGSGVDITNLTGELGATAGDITIGNSTPEAWPQMCSEFSFRNKLGVAGGTAGTIYFKAPSAGTTQLPNKLTGTGPYGFYGKLTLLDACTDGSWWQVRDNADVTVSGGVSYTDSANGLFLYANSKLTLDGDAAISGQKMLPTSGFAGNVLRQDYGLKLGKDEGSVNVSESAVLRTMTLPKSLAVCNGGIVELTSGYDDKDVTATWDFDGGCLFLNPATSGYTFNATPKYEASALFRVGAGGVTLRSLPKTSVYSSGSMQFVFRRPIEALEASDGGVTRFGGGFFDFWHPLAIKGPFANLDGTLRIPNQTAITEASVPLFGTGDFRLGNARLEYSGDIAKSFTAKIGTGGLFLYEGAATIRVRESVNRPVQTLALGELTRGADGGALYFWDNSYNVAYNDSGTAVTFTEAPATAADGRITQPVFTYAADRFDFAAYGNDGLKAFTDYTAFSDAGAGDTAVTPNSVTHVADDKSVAALKLNGVSSSYGDNAPLWIDGDATLTIGSGTSPACLIMNGNGKNAPAAIRGTGTLSFGGREAVVVANNRVATDAGDGYAAIHTKISDADGLTITRAATLDAAHGVALYGNNDYAGKTRVYGTRVLPRSPDAFSSGAVEIGNGELQGGVLMMDVEGLTVANAIRAAGWGASAVDDEGAITFTKSGTLAGSVEVYDEARFVARSGARGTFAGSVSGSKVWIWKGEGEICFANANACTGGVEVVGSTLVLTDGGTSGTGDIILNNGTLVLENAEAKTVSNRVYGKGCIRLAGKGVVDVANLVSEDDVGFALDLGRKVSEISSLKGFSAITTSRTKPTALIVADGDISSFAGTVPANVTLYRPGEYTPNGLTLIVR